MPMLRGQMMDRPLLTTSILHHAALVHGEAEVVSRFGREAAHRYTWRDAWNRTRQLAHVLVQLGVRPGDRVATLAWNDHRHLELYYAIAGLGAVCHTVNPRLFPEQITYILNHAEDRVVFADPMFLPLLEKLMPGLTTVKTVVAMTTPDLMPAQSGLPDLRCYETLMAAHGPDFAFPEFDENTAAGLCYTSGTTGNPKGVLYSHRSNVLHAYGTLTAPGLELNDRAVVLPIVPLFHVNAWGFPFVSPMVGAKLVLPGPKLDGKSVYDLIEAEGVTCTSGVPTVWLMLLNHLRDTGARFSTLKTITIGGSAAPRTMIEAFEKQHGVEVVQGWGMTEMSPIGTLGGLTPAQKTLPHDARIDQKLKAGRALYGVEMKAVDANEQALPRDGVSRGELVVRGPWITSGYYRDEAANRSAFTADGWFRTGDVATIDDQGFMTIVDRAKDVIKSGGEWISSIDLENAAMGHPAVQQAAVIGLPHPKWQERPLLIIVPRQGAELDRDTLMAFLAGRIARWWMPDDIVFLEQMPLTATGKVQKTELRRMFKDHSLPDAGLAAE